MKYRIRTNSISGSKRLNQHLTVIYIIRLFEERIKKGSDDYSEGHYNQFIKSRITDRSKKRFEKALNYLKNALYTNNKLLKLLFQAKAFCLSEPLRYSYIYKKTHEDWFKKKLEQAQKGKVTII